jgi:DNA-binding response OmpR family regulator
LSGPAELQERRDFSYTAIVPPARRRPTILVVEDDAALRAYYRSVLTLEGYAVVTAVDGVDALERIEEQPVGAVILDLGLPRLAGEDVGRELASHPSRRSIPVIVVTGQDTDGLDLTSFTCVLHKPVTGEALVRAITDCLHEV